VSPPETGDCVEPAPHVPTRGGGGREEGEGVPPGRVNRALANIFLKYFRMGESSLESLGRLKPD
jgi:hypothetical protein